MALKGTFRKQLAVLPDGTQRNIYSLVLTNTDWLGQQQFTIVLSDMGMSKKASFDITLKSGKAIELDVRNTGWDWCMGDFAMVVDKKGREKERWNFTPKVYAPGTCPECHGTHRCKACDGRGQWFDKTRRAVICPTCHGTGQCQTCFVPVREGSPSYSTPNPLSQSPVIQKSHRSVVLIQSDIRQKERELDQVTKDLDRRTNPQPTQVIQSGWPYPGTTVYVKPNGDFSSYTYHLSRRKAELEHEIKELYRELANAESNG